MSTTTTDRIEKQIMLRTPRSRVWRAITDEKEFGAWFQCIFDRPFAPGAKNTMRLTHPEWKHLTFDIVVERVEPEQFFSYRWHPYAIDPEADYSKEPMTLVEFRLEDAQGGTLLTVSESGFDQIPVARRAEALKANEGGWASQVAALEKYLGRNP